MTQGSRRREAECWECTGDPDRPAWTSGVATITPTPLKYDSDPTPKANRLGEETTTRQPTLPDAALGLDRCMELRLGRVQDQEARTQPRAPRGRGGATPGPDTDPKLNAQWVSLS